MSETEILEDTEEGTTLIRGLGHSGIVEKSKDFRFSLSFLPHQRRYTVDSFIFSQNKLGEGKFGA